MASEPLRARTCLSTVSLEWEPTVVDAVKPITNASVRSRSQT